MRRSGLCGIIPRLSDDFLNYILYFVINSRGEAVS